MKNERPKVPAPKKPFYTRKWFIILAAFILISGIGKIFGLDEEPNKIAQTGDPSISSKAQTNGNDTVINDQSSQVSKAEASEKETIKWQGDDLLIQKVNNDKTGKWRIAVISSSKPQDNYAFEYYQRYMKNEPDSNNLFIVNLGLRTTTQIFVSDSTLDITVHEYVDGEEHDAVKLNSGMDLQQTKILDKNTGEIIMAQ